MQEIELLGLYNSLLIFFIVLFFSNSFSQSNFPHKIDSLLKFGIDNLINQNYDEAKNIFTELDQEYSLNPLGKIYLAALEIAKNYDLAENFNEAYIENKFREAEKIIEDFHKKNKNEASYEYFKALANGYSAYFEALNENWLAAVADGYNSIKSFDRCLQIDSTFYDAYIAIGTFNYWKSEKIDWLPFIKDETKLGINFLLKAINNPSYNNYLAAYSLQWIYINEKRFNDAVKISKEALKKYPGSRFFKWGTARAYEEIDKEKSIEIYNEILYSYKNLKNMNGKNEIILKHLIAQQYERLGNYKKALELCNEIISKKNLIENVKYELQERLIRVKELKEKLKKSIN